MKRYALGREWEVIDRDQKSIAPIRAFRTALAAMRNVVLNLFWNIKERKF